MKQDNETAPLCTVDGTGITSYQGTVLVHNDNDAATSNNGNRDGVETIGNSSNLSAVRRLFGRRSALFVAALALALAVASSSFSSSSPPIFSDFLRTSPYQMQEYEAVSEDEDKSLPIFGSAFRQANCNFKFPDGTEITDLKHRGDDTSTYSRCCYNNNCFPGDANKPNAPPNMLVMDAPGGLTVNWRDKSWVNCLFNVKFPNGKMCHCDVEMVHYIAFADLVKGGYLIRKRGCDCMRIEWCEGDRCPGDGRTGEWPCDSPGCAQAPDVTLTILPK